MTGSLTRALGLLALCALLASCSPTGDAIYCRRFPCVADVCGTAIRVPGDRHLHRLDPNNGLLTACGLDLRARAVEVDPDEATEALRAGEGHGPCWRAED